ncbi:hypothetical protein [Kitasatospora purpeofusca]|uniref:hypothetical protein n=1 Tax=Kitasatospora purpeofusca TaxID=67352 RepID=UPI00366171F7
MRTEDLYLAVLAALVPRPGRRRGGALRSSDGSSWSSRSDRVRYRHGTGTGSAAAAIATGTGSADATAIATGVTVRR